MLSLSLVALSFTPVPTLFTPLQDWPGWRGPSASGVATGSPPTEFGEEKHLRWKAPIPGRGNSSPVVWGERVYLTTSVPTGTVQEAIPEPIPEPGAEEGGEERGGRRGRGGRGEPETLAEQDFLVLAFDRASGEIVWECKVNTAMPHQGTHPDGTYASATPVTDGERIYVSFGSFGVYALSLDGEVLWGKDLGNLDIMRSFGEGSSPVLHGDLLILNWDHEGESFLVAFDKASGEERWRTPRPGGTSWCTPVVVHVGDADQIVIPGAQSFGYEPSTGRVLWSAGEAPGGRGGGLISSAAVIDELIVFPGGGRTGELSGFIVPAGMAADSEEQPQGTLLWTERGLAPHVPSLLVFEGMVYALKQNSGILAVIDASTGKTEYGPERLQGVTEVYATPVAAGGRIYIAGRDGTVEVLSAWPEVKTLAVNTLDETIDATPAVAGDELFLRGYANVYCFATE
jgi:outer membrane protein assembly factor BamB